MIVAFDSVPTDVCVVVRIVRRTHRDSLIGRRHYDIHLASC